MTQIAVYQLEPGDAVASFAGQPPGACFIARTRHPLYAGLELVVWRTADGGWSHDALDGRQVVGDLEPTTSEVRRARLRAALSGPDGDWTQVPS